MAKPKKKKKNKNRKQSKPTGAIGSPSQKPTATKELSKENQLQDVETRLDNIDAKHSEATMSSVKASAEGKTLREDFKVEVKAEGDSLHLSRLKDFVERAATGLDAVEDAKKKLATDRSRFVRDKSKLDDEKNHLAADQKDVKESRSEVDKRTKDLNQRQERMLEREQDADQDFVQRDEKFLENLEEKIETKQSELDALHQQIHETKRQAATENRDLKDLVFKDIETMDEKVDEKEAALTKRETQVNRRLTAIENREELFEESTKYVNEQVVQGMESEKQNYVHKIDELKSTKQIHLNEIKRLQSELEKSQVSELYIKGMTKEEVESHVADLEGQLGALTSKLATRLSDGDQDELIDLRKTKMSLEDENLRQAANIRSKDQMNHELEKIVLENDVKQTEVDSYKSQKQVLKAAVDELREQVDGLTRVKDNKPVFPALQEMDQDRDLQKSPELYPISSMKKFSDTIRIQMASSADPRYYSEQDVRSFLGGMAMSRLHILQGISGTGKTSLPIAICEAANWGHHVVPVQAGWRDRHDLLGNYNSFERKYYESEFLQHLYMASLPRWNRLPYIIVLDEMNLSNPEQYFADLLSVLETKKDTLDLLTSQPHFAPKLLEDGGRKIRVPDNVWFVGTANHDETTKELADKTYDRSFVLELPHQYEEVEPNEKTLLIGKGVSLDSLQAGFRKAESTHEKDVVAAWELLEAEVADILAEQFDIGWGNRNKKFVPTYGGVVMACGGTKAEALDRFLAMKVLRKIRGRYETDKTDLEALEDKLTGSFDAIEENYDPIHCMKIITTELKRFQRG
jgi:hypothetical protein